MHVRLVDQRQRVALEREQVPRRVRRLLKAGELAVRAVRHDVCRRVRHVRLGISPSRSSESRRGERDQRLFRLADEHAVDVRRALHRLRRRRRRVRAEAEHRRAELLLELAPSRRRRRRASASCSGTGSASAEALAIEPRDDVRRSTGARRSRRSSRTSQPASRSSEASSASVYGGLVVPSTSSRSWQRPWRVNATPLMSGGLTSSVWRPSMVCSRHWTTVSGNGAPRRDASGNGCATGSATAPPCSSAGRPGRSRARAAGAASRRNARRSRSLRATTASRSPTSTRMNGQK